MYSCKETTRQSQLGKKNVSRKLAPIAEGPYFVKDMRPASVLVQIEDRIEHINLNRLTPALGPVVVGIKGPSTSEIRVPKEKNETK